MSGVDVEETLAEIAAIEIVRNGLVRDVSDAISEFVEISESKESEDNRFVSADVSVSVGVFGSVAKSVSKSVLACVRKL